MFCFADGPSGFEAVHFRHLDIHQDEVEALRAEGLESLFAVFDRDDVMAALLRIPRATRWLTGLSSAMRICRGPFAGSTAVRGWADFVGGEPAGKTTEAMASSSSDCLMGFVKYALTPISWKRCGIGGLAAEESIMSGRLAIRGSDLTRARA